LCCTVEITISNYFIDMIVLQTTLPKQQYMYTQSKKCDLKEKNTINNSIECNGIEVNKIDFQRDIWIYCALFLVYKIIIIIIIIIIIMKIIYSLKPFVLLFIILDIAIDP